MFSRLSTTSVRDVSVQTHTSQQELNLRSPEATEHTIQSCLQASTALCALYTHTHTHGRVRVNSSRAHLKMVICLIAQAVDLCTHIREEEPSCLPLLFPPSAERCKCMSAAAPSSLVLDILSLRCSLNLRRGVSLRSCDAVAEETPADCEERKRRRSY